MAKILGSHCLEALRVDVRDARQGEFAGHQQLATAKGEEDWVFARTLWGFMMGDEGQWKRTGIGHAIRLPELGAFHRSQGPIAVWP